MKHNKAFQQLLGQYFTLNSNCLTCLIRIILGLFITQSANLAKLSRTFSATTKHQSVYKWLQRSATLSKPSNPLIALVSKFVFRAILYVSLHKSLCFRNNFRIVKNKKTKEVIGYSHQALQPIICHPDQKQILPLMLQDIANTDGYEKQDCEVNAAKRLLPKIRKDHPRMSFIWVADSFYATDPFISKILEHKEDYIFRVQKGDHKHTCALSSTT